VGYLVEGGDFTAWTTKVGLDWGFVDRAKLTPFVALTPKSLSANPRSKLHNLGATTDNEFVGGCMLSAGF
jgi:hypothetical protein